jgi:hypothetical protein
MKRLYLTLRFPVVAMIARAFAKLKDDADARRRAREFAETKRLEIKNVFWRGVRRDDVIVRLIDEYDGVSAQNREAA